MSSSKPFRVITTKEFRKEAELLKRKYPNIKEDFLELAEQLKQDPITGNASLGKDCYKVRMKISDKSKGQSGGARVIINVEVKDNDVYVLSVYDKSEIESLTDKEISSLLARKGD